MSGYAEIDLALTNTGQPVYVSKFFGSARGVAWSVEDQRGRRQPPAEPMPISPPEPPPPPYLPGQSLAEMGRGMILLERGATIRVKVQDFAKWIFPGPGDWRVRLHLRLRNAHPPLAGGRSEPDIELVSEPVTVRVTA